MKTFALVGNPNCGKTTLFNALTGSTAHVGNWPGVTVDKKEGYCNIGEEKVAIIDLPGIYSLSPYTPEEVISRNYILDEKPFGIINIVDATNLERNLYLTTQLLETDVPVIVALNMMDEVERVGDSIDEVALEEALGVPVVKISALKRQSTDVLMSRAIELKERKGTTVLKGILDRQLAAALAFFEALGVPSPLFHAVKIMEGDEIELEHKGAKELVGVINPHGNLDAIIADEKYKYISKHFSSTKTRSRGKTGELTRSDKLDRVLTHRIWGIPLFILILFSIFHLTFSENLLFLNGFGRGWMPTLDELGIEGLGATFLGLVYDGTVYSPGVILTNILALFTDTLTGCVAQLVGMLHGAPWVSSLICDAVLGGIFSVLGFLPQILFLFLGFSILEDTGYMARVAFILDRIFRKFGLSGRAFMPMIMGFGCSVPAMINTRTLADEQERTATVRVIPFFSCGAKLPILTAMSGALMVTFGVGNADIITYSMYILGIAVAIISVLIMRNTTMKGEVPPFIMELPAYHMPLFTNLMLHLWDKAKHFIEKAFTVIFASTVIIWVMQSFSWGWEFLLQDVDALLDGTAKLTAAQAAELAQNSEYFRDMFTLNGEQVVTGLVNLRTNESILGGLGRLIQPVFTPLGFGSQLSPVFGWVFAVAVLSGLIAKENVIATFGALAAVVAGAYVDWETNEVAAAVAIVQGTGITVPAIISFIVFNMTTVPCFAACATAKAELKKGKFRFTVLFWIITSYITSCVVYTVGSYVWTLPVWVGLAAVIALVIVLNNKGKLEKFKFRKKGKKE